MLKRKIKEKFQKEVNWSIQNYQQRSIIMIANQMLFFINY